jgi:hypothetical protein
LDVAGSIASLAGDFEITGAVALALSLLWGSREGLPGLTPLLLFVGVAIEVALKHFAELIGRHKKSWRRIGWVLVGVMAFTCVCLNVHWGSVLILLDQVVFAQANS